ncbi:MAG TPA: HD domain-containing protein [Chthoniobacteraceae bacterium]|nr:HD domain-containing protein [Chthoniobacteraceae bacterium]
MSKVISLDSVERSGRFSAFVETLTIAALKRLTLEESRVESEIHAQAEACIRKDTRDGKPFFELVVADSEAKLSLKAWSDSPAFSICEKLSPGEFLAIRGEFAHSPQFGLEAKRWTARPLDTNEREALLAGPPALRERQAADFAYIESALASINDPRLHSLVHLFLADFGDRFRRAAAARGNHHARRGGLVEHTAQMMRSADAIAAVYRHLNRDLMLTGVLFHDCGKLWENSYPADGFTMPYDERGELLGHITIGIELINSLWRKLVATPEFAAWKDTQPANEDVRLHLLHLIASHHGELQFGSPVVPKTPEAWALHYVDNLDAKMEMIAGAYANSKQLAPRIRERVWPLAGHVVLPLPRVEGGE